MRDFTGVIIEESLRDKSVLDEVKIIKTEVEPVTENHETSHVKQWTMHTVEVNSEDAEKVAERLSKSLEGNKETGYWYADYKNYELAYIIFPNKIFKISRGDLARFQEAKEYGISLGIPEYQVDFSS